MHPRDLMRENEKLFKSQNLNDPSLSTDELIQALVNDPVLLQRPIVADGKRAILARPPEKVLNFLDV